MGRSSIRYQRCKSWRKGGATITTPQTTLLAGLQTTGPGSVADGKRKGAWKSGKPTTLPTFPHPRRLRDNYTTRYITLTISLVQKIGQATRAWIPSWLEADPSLHQKPNTFSQTASAISRFCLQSGDGPYIEYSRY